VGSHVYLRLFFENPIKVVGPSFILGISDQDTGLFIIEHFRIEFVVFSSISDQFVVCSLLLFLFLKVLLITLCQRFHGLFGDTHSGTGAEFEVVAAPVVFLKFCTFDQGGHNFSEFW